MGSRFASSPFLLLPGCTKSPRMQASTYLMGIEAIFNTSEGAFHPLSALFTKSLSLSLAFSVRFRAHSGCSLGVIYVWYMHPKFFVKKHNDQ